MAVSTPVSKALSDLLAEQKRQTEMLRTQYDKAQSKNDQHWQQQKLTQRHQQQTGQAHLRARHAQAEKLYAQLVKQGQWTQAQLEQEKKRNKEARLSQQQMHAQQRLNTQQAYDAARRGLRSSYRGGQATLDEHARQKRDDLRETHRQEREQERTRKLQAREQEQRRQGRYAIAHRGLAGVRAAAGVGNALQAPFLSGEQRLHAVGESLSQLGGKAGVIGEAITGFIDLKRMLDGTTLALSHLSMASSLIPVQARGLGEYTSMLHQGEFGIQQHMARAETLQGLTGPKGMVSGLGDVLVRMAGRRNTWEGELAYQKASQRFGPQVQLQRAEAELEAARRAHAAATRQVETGYASADPAYRRRDIARQIGRDAAGRVSRLPTGMGQLREYERASQRFRGNIAAAGDSGFHIGGYQIGGDQKAMAAALEAALKGQEAGLGAIRVIQEDINRQKQTAITMAEKELAVSKARLNVAKAEQQITAQKEQRQSGAATAIGRMTLAERSQLNIGLRMLDRGMPLHLMPAPLRGVLERTAGAAMNKRYEQAGLNTPEYRALQERGLVDKGGLGKTRQDLAKIDADIQVKLALDEGQLAERLAAAIAKHMDQALKVVESKIKVELDRNATGQAVRHAGQH